MTARKIIEKRLGYKWPETRKLAADQRRAIKTLAIQVIKNLAAERSSNACPPCHGDCNQGRNCPARKVRA